MKESISDEKNDVNKYTEIEKWKTFFTDLDTFKEFIIQMNISTATCFLGLHYMF